MRRAWAAFERHDGFKQIAIVLVALGVYETARSLIEPDWAAAIANAERIAELERGLSFAWEQSLQRAFLGVPDLVEAMNVFYFVGHFVLTGVFFLWLYRASSDGFRSFRNGFIAATAIAVVIHWWFPTAPPRVVGDLGIMDTLRVFWDVDIGSPHASAFSNPVAAVPSLHAGWAVGVGVGLVRYAKRPTLAGARGRLSGGRDADDRGHREPLHLRRAGRDRRARSGFHGHGTPQDPAPRAGLAYLRKRRGVEQSGSSPGS